MMHCWICDKLQQLMGDLKAILFRDGILLRPQLRKKLKLSKQKVSLRITSLPLQSKRDRKKKILHSEIE